MAVWTACAKEMLEGGSCDVAWITWANGSYERVRYGAEAQHWRAAGCGDCGVPRGGFHHPGCDIEDCPRCGRQLITCRCGEPLC